MIELKIKKDTSEGFDLSDWELGEIGSQIEEIFRKEFEKLMGVFFSERGAGATMAAYWDREKKEVFIENVVYAGDRQGSFASGKGSLKDMIFFMIEGEAIDDLNDIADSLSSIANEIKGWL